MSKTFLYFAYGSNLLKQRIHIENPSAVRVGIARLDNFRLDFIRYSNRWKGASATIVPHQGYHIWGALWEIDETNLTSLDNQEGVADNIYFGFEVDVYLPDKSFKKCRVYQQTIIPPHIPIKELPLDRRPSGVYLTTMIKGAEESNLPKYYQKFLGTVPHNGYMGTIDIKLNLN